MTSLVRVVRARRAPCLLGKMRYELKLECGTIVTRTCCQPPKRGRCEDPTHAHNMPEPEPEPVPRSGPDPRSYEGRGFLHPYRNAKATAAKAADVRARVLRVLVLAGDHGITTGDVCGDLATRCSAIDVRRTLIRLGGEGAIINANRGHGPRWYLTDAGRDAAGKAAA